MVSRITVPIGAFSATVAVYVAALSTKQQSRVSNNNLVCQKQSSEISDQILSSSLAKKKLLKFMIFFLETRYMFLQKRNTSIFTINYFKRIKRQKTAISGQYSSKNAPKPQFLAFLTFKQNNNFCV